MDLSNMMDSGLVVTVKSTDPQIRMAAIVHAATKYEIEQWVAVNVGSKVVIMPLWGKPS